MSLVLPRFYAIIDRSLRPELTLAHLAGTLREAGVTLIQFRAKQAPGRQFLSETQELLSHVSPSLRVVVNDRADVAWLAGAAGVHLGQQDLLVAAARTLLGPEKLIGISTHTPTQVEAADATLADYVAFGPIFPTKTKAEAERVVGLERLRDVCRCVRKPLVAIGGITPANAAQVIEAGADVVAVISGWMQAQDIPQRLAEFRQALGRLN
ncbi:MAG: thiamine phosphate synthase [Terriglobia bacterium]